MKRPNVILMVSDQHNAKVLGHAGHPDVKTPHLDRMARGGVRFSTAITQNPICTPSRVSFHSGQYCHNHGYYGLEGPKPSIPTVFGHFRRHGYTTAAIGKIHCPEYWIEDDTDVFHETVHCSVEGRSPKYTAFLKDRGKLEQEDHAAMLELGPKGVQSLDARPSSLTFDECQEGWIANEGVAFMEEAQRREQPFFLHLSFPRPHQCTAPCQEFWDLYKQEELHLPPNADQVEGKSPALQSAARGWREKDHAIFEPKDFESFRRRKLHGYLGAVSQVDHAVGQVLDYLQKSGLHENTIVVYTADHGEYAGEHGILEKAPAIGSDAVTRVPLIWRGPGLSKNLQVDEIVELVDLAPTFCALTGLPAMETADGKDATALLKGGKESLHRVGVTEFPWSQSVRRGPWRFVYYPPEMFAEEYPNGFGELYNLEEDPWEMKNLYFDPNCREKVIEMQEELLRFRITTTRPVTVMRPIPTRDYSTASPQRVIRYHHVLNGDGKTGPASFAESASRSNYL